MTSERQLTANATQMTFEENYLTIDVKPENTSDNGYQFEYPIQWLRDRSEKKAVGLRRLEIIPAAFVIPMEITINFSTGAKLYVELFSVPSSSSTLDFLDKFATFINELKDNYTDYPLNVRLEFRYTYDAAVGTLTYGIFPENSTDSLSFVMSLNAMKGWMKVFNQPIEQAEADVVQDIIEIYNVWNRTSDLYWHATFSNSHHNFIATNGERWNTPSVLYPHNSSDNTFTVWCTLNGQKKIIPLYGTFIVQLCFIVNYRNTIVF
jgi:hypothetical protein